MVYSSLQVSKVKLSISLLLMLIAAPAPAQENDPRDNLGGLVAQVTPWAPLIPDALLPSQGEAEKRELIRRNVLYREQRVRRYAQRPELFYADQAALRGGREAREWMRYLEKEISFAQLTRLIPSVSAGGTIDFGFLEFPASASVRTAAAYDLTKDKDRIRLLRDRMLANPQEMFNVAGQIQVADYNVSNSNTNIGRYLKTALLYDEKLPLPVSSEALTIRHPNLNNSTSFLNLNSMESAALDALASGRIRLSDFLKISGQSATEFYNEIANELARRQVSLPEDVLQDTVDQANRERETAELNSDIETARANVNGAASVLNLIDPDAAQTFSAIGNGSLDLAHGLGDLAINGFSIASLGAAAGGLSSIMSVFGSGPSASEIMNKKLDSILANQTKILDKLSNIEEDIGYIKEKIEFIYSIMSEEFENINQRLHFIQEELVKIQNQSFILLNFTRRGFQESALREVTNQEAGFEELFHPESVNSFYSDLIACRYGKDECTNAAAEVYNKDLIFILGMIRRFITEEIVNGVTFRGERGFGGRDKLSDAELIGFLGLPIEQRVSLFEGILNGLSSDFGIHVAQTHGSPTDLARIGHPTYNALLTEKYVNLASRLPEGWHRLSGRVGQICTKAEDIERTSMAFRSLAPPAFDQYVVTYRRLISEIQALFSRAIVDPKYRMPRAEPFDGQSNAYAGVLFANYSRQEIEKELKKIKAGILLDFARNIRVLEELPAIKQSSHHDHTRKRRECRERGGCRSKYYDNFIDHTTILTKRVTFTEEARIQLRTTSLGAITYFHEHVVDRKYERRHHRAGQTDRLRHSMSGLSSSDRAVIELTITDYVSSKHRSILNELIRPQIKELPSYRTFIELSIQLDTLISGGYGSCLQMRPELVGVKSLRKALASTYLEHVTKMPESSEMKELVDAMQKKLNHLELNSENALSIGSKILHDAALFEPENLAGMCSFGMGQQNLTRRVLARTVEHQDLRPTRSSCMVAYE